MGNEHLKIDTKNITHTISNHPKMKNLNINLTKHLEDKFTKC
jgi:hypothetical protein